MSDDAPHYACDLCGYQSGNLDAVHAHLADAHGITNPAVLGSIEQRAGLLVLRNGDDETVIDLAAWLLELLDEEVRE